MQNICKIFLLLLTILAIISCQKKKDISTKNDFISYGNIWSSPYSVDTVYKHHLVNREGKYLFILNKTAWAYFECKYPEKVIEKANLQGVNIIRVCLEGTPFDNVLNIDLWPWGGTRENPDWLTFNNEYWNRVEERIHLAGENGIGIDLVLYFDLKPEISDISNQKVYWNQILNRLSKFSNILTWEIMNEETENEAFQDSAGIYFKRNDPFHRPVCSSDGTSEDALWPYKTWMDLAIVHTCTGMQENYDLEYWYLNIARNVRQYGKPAFNNETGREKRHKNDDPVHRRKQSWLFTTTGVFWTWHSWEGCEGINDTTYWGPGWEYLKPLKKYYESVPFWEMEPNYTTCIIKEKELIHTTLSTTGREITIMYCCTRETGKTTRHQKAYVRLRNGEYEVRYINPSDLRYINNFILKSDGLKNQYEINLPEFTDDLLVEIDMLESEKKTLVEGTL